MGSKNEREMKLENVNGLYGITETFPIDAINCTLFRIIKGFIPVIVDITVTKDKKGNDRSVIVEFSDGQKIESAAQYGDKFDLRQGIERCIVYEMFSHTCGVSGSDGHKIFNKLVDRAMKFYKRKLADIEAYEKAVAEDKRIAANKLKKKQKRIDKIKAKRRAERIAEMTEAYVNAIRTIRDETVTDADKEVNNFKETTTADDLK